MAEHLRFVDATNGSPYYDSADYAQAEEVKANGIAYNYLNELEVIQFEGLQVKVKDGALVSKGRTYIQDEPSNGNSPKILTLEAAQVGYLRKDMVVVEFDLENSLAVAKIVEGVEDISDPIEPALTEESNIWQVSLAVINVDETTITNIEDKRVIGNGRTNPAFKKDVSAPNIKVNENGKLYLNDDETAYLQFADNGLNLKVPNRDETKMLGGLVAEVVLESDASSIILDNLDINADGGMYKVYVIGYADENAYYNIEYNGNVSSTDYEAEYNMAFTGANSPNNIEDARAGRAGTGAFKAKHIIALSNGIPMCKTEGMYVTVGGTLVNYTFAQVYKESIPSEVNITSLKLEMQNGTFYTGTTFKIVKGS